MSTAWKNIYQTEHCVFVSVEEAESALSIQKQQFIEALEAMKGEYEYVSTFEPSEPMYCETTIDACIEKLKNL